MRNIYTGIDIGSDNIKILVLEKYKNKINVLAATRVLSSGVKKGLIVDSELTANSIKKGIKDIESKLGTKIDKVVAIIPSNNREILIKNGSTKINEIDSTITGNDVYLCLQDAIKDIKTKDFEVVTTTPIEYTLDDETNIKNPIGKSGSNLSVKAVVTVVPKKNLLSVVGTLKLLNIEVVDVTFSSIGDYYAVKNDDLDKTVAVIVNIGSETINISVFNKGIIIKNQILDLGSNKIDNDIDFVYKISKKDIYKIKEEFAVGSKKYADKEEIFRTINKFNVKIEINQHELAEVIEARVVDILKIIKKQINDLTNKEIGYIIITGGITDMAGIGAIVDDIFVKNTSLLNLNVLGIRSNSYSTCYGMINYLIEKLEGRGKNYTMFSDNQVEEIMAPRRKTGVSSVLNKIFGHFFE